MPTDPIRTVLDSADYSLWRGKSSANVPGYPPLGQPYLAPAEALAHMEHGLSNMSNAIQTHSLFSHPDERVVAEAHKRYGWQLTQSNNTLDRDALAWRVGEIERVEPGVWTPIHDLVRSASDPRTVKARTDVARWLKGQSDPRSALSLLNMPAAYWHTLAIRQMPRWDPGVLGTVWAHVPRLLARAVSKLRLDAGTTEALRSLALGTIDGSIAPPKDGVNMGDRAEAARQVLSDLQTQHPLSVPELDRILRVPDQRRPNEYGPEAVRTSAALHLLHSVRDMGPEVFESLYQRTEIFPESLALVLNHPDCPMPLVRRAAVDSGAVTVRRAIMAREDAIRDPAVRAGLMARGRDSYVMMRLIATAPEGEPVSEGVLGDLVRHNPGRAISLIEEGVIAPGTPLPASVVQGLLTGKEEAVRGRAMGILHQVTIDDTAPETPPRPRRRRA